MIFYQKTENGFSLVETLVAISILLIVIVGPMSISMRSAKSSSFASEQIQAFFLAQEGLELAQKARDEYLLGYFNGSIGNPWGSFTGSGSTYLHCFASSGCGLQWQATNNNATNNRFLATPTACSASCLLYRANSGRSWFTHNSSGAEATPFTRVIKFTYDTGRPDEVKVVSTVTWRTGSIVSEQKVEVDTYLYNVYDI